MSTEAWLVIGAVVVAILAVVAFFVIRRRRYGAALRDPGWAFETAPALASRTSA